MKAFTIKDEKAEGFNTPFFQTTFGLAERAFKEACDDPHSQIHKNKADFSLYYIGEFDHTSGLIQTEGSPKHICNAL